MTQDTITAIATPPGEGGVAVIRISGDRALEVGDAVFSGSGSKSIQEYTTHTVHHGHILDKANNKTNNPIDEVLLLIMRAPRSYTGEDTVEIHCHGGSLITRRVLETVIAAGARPAQPGEFTLRAFLNGKMDLAQAEAVQELISAKNECAVNAAGERLQGKLSKKIKSFQQRLSDAAGILEAWVDFPEEGLEFATPEAVCANLAEITNEIHQLADTFHDGKMIQEGVSICLAGSPNVGKSSLMNALLDRERAIVTPIPGTTRDVLEDHLHLNGLHIKLLDTAGIRDTTEIVELEGVRRSWEAMKNADLVLILLDATQKDLTNQEKTLLQESPKNKTIIAWNKIDLPHGHGHLEDLGFSCIVEISAKEHQGLDTLRQAIDTMIWRENPPDGKEILITNVRHRQALMQSAEACRKVQCGLRGGVSPEFLTSDMRHCLNELGSIIGTDVTEDILSSIFSKFCIGK